ncbi:MAG TPA: glycosyltransferase [Polyangiaceae bacterium]|nr:glycosyltransferase [Polyangiaceae bacterium]
MPPRVSVVIPTYKSAAWVEETLESVVRQTYAREQLEIVVVDDASPDDSVAVAKRFLEKHDVDNRVVAREKNAGVAANRNAGWRLANGDWIQFLDADDLLSPHKIELQARVASTASDDVAVVYSNWQYYTLEGDVWQPTGPVNAPFVDRDPVVQILQNQSFGYVGPTLIRKSFLARIGGFEEKPNLGEDTDLMLRLAMAGGQFREARSAEAAFLYRQSPGSLWRAYVKNVDAMRNLMGTFRRAEDFLRARDSAGRLPEEARAALAVRYSKWATFYLENDPETYQWLKTSLQGLGLKRPLNLSPALDILSRVIGFENAVRARSSYRKQRDRFRTSR